MAETNKNRDAKSRFLCGDYDVGWICALHTELAAAQAVLDSIHAHPSDSRRSDSNSYSFGSIGDCNIVIACLPAGHYGTSTASVVASNMMQTFPNLDVGLMVGIGGGVPDAADVRLGDIVVGLEVIQHDYGKISSEAIFKHTAIPIRPPQHLLTKVAQLRANHALYPTKVSTILSEAMSRYPKLLQSPRSSLEDRLFHSSFDHKISESNCARCDEDQIIKRPQRDSIDPLIHYGRVASGNQVIKDGQTRAKLANDLNVLCFEMEAAGLVNHFPCLVIRGICDYCDSHKGKHWQEYAALVAASYAKELLLLTCTKEPHDEVLTQRDDVLKQRDTLMGLLVFEDMESRCAVVEDAYAETCTWLLELPEYTAWQDAEAHSQHHGLLWIMGKPGAGKSTLMKFIYTQNVQRGAADESAPQPAVISFFFNARGAKLERTAIGMYRSLLFQLMTQFPSLKKVLDRLIKSSRGAHSGFIRDIKTLQALLTNAMTDHEPKDLRCFIDALDECDEAEIQDMVDFFENIGAIAVQQNLQVRICLSSRHYPFIRTTRGLSVTLEKQRGHSRDLESYVLGRIDLGKGPASNKVAQDILAKASGVFLWVILAVRIINSEFRRGRIFAVQKRLRELPSELSKLFQNIIAKDRENMEDFLLCIQWIIYSKAPLSSQEFYFALVAGLDPTFENLGPWDKSHVTLDDMERFVLSASKGLAEVVQVDNHTTVQFIHQSVRDFLVNEGGIRELWSDRSVGFEEVSHEQLKQCCKAYYDAVDKSPLASFDGDRLPYSWPRIPAVTAFLEQYPFLKYATTFILHHANAAAPSVPQDEFLGRLDISTWDVLHGLFVTPLPDIAWPRLSSRIDLLTILAEQDLVNLIQPAMQNVVKPHDLADMCTSALGAACLSGHDAIVGLLLSCGRGDVNRKDPAGRTALYHAARMGHSSIVRRLLATGVADINSPAGQAQKAPVMAASESGHANIVKLLIAANAEIDCHDCHGVTPLLAAVLCKRPSVVQVLVELGADVNRQEKGQGDTALLFALKNRDNNMVRILLQTQGIEVNRLDSWGNSPLHIAIKMNDLAAVEMLLRVRDINVNMKDSSGNSPLTKAAKLKRNNIMGMLLAARGIDVNMVGPLGQTPLMVCIISGNEDASRMLLAVGAVDINLTDDTGSTATDYAWLFNYDDIMNLLLARRDRS